MLDEAFQTLSQYNWGTDIAQVAPIDDAVAKAHGNAKASRDLEKRLVTALGSNISRDAKDYVCRKLAIIGSADAVPALGAMLGDANHSHMARFALERIPDADAAKALRDALPKVNDTLKVGVLSSIGARRDTAAVPALSGLLKDGDDAVERAAALALGAIGSAEAVAALQASTSSASGGNAAVSDALLSCAEALLADNQQAGALAVYKQLAENQQSRLVRLAATRGMLACMARQG